MANFDVVYEDAEYAIILNHAFFGSGFNVYKKLEDGLKGEKINPAMSWFGTQQAAEKFLNEYRANNKDADNG